MAGSAFGDPHFSWREVSLRECERRFCAVPPLEAIGVLNHWYTSERSEFSGSPRGGLEFTIRLSSTAETMEEEIDGKRCVSRFPNVIMKVPGIRHVQVVEAPRDAVFFHYSSATVRRFLEYHMLTPPYHWECELSPELMSVLQRIVRVIARPLLPGDADRLDVLALECVYELLISRASGFDVSEVEARIRRIAVHLQLHFLEDIDLEQLAAANGFSRSTFFRHWRTYHEVSPAKYLLNIRLEEAARLLVESSLKVHEIAEAVSFAYPEYFCQSFKKRFGISPQRYRVARSSSSE